MRLCAHVGVGDKLSTGTITIDSFPGGGDHAVNRNYANDDKIRRSLYGCLEKM